MATSPMAESLMTANVSVLLTNYYFFILEFSTLLALFFSKQFLKKTKSATKYIAIPNVVFHQQR
jgi:hypothetical protein